MNLFPRMKILVTGASGFIGRYLVAGLAKKHKVRAFGRTKIEGIEFFKGDIKDFNSIKNALKEIDVVIHLGAITAGQEPLLTLDTDVKGTYNLVEAAVQKKVKKIIFASSIAAYGCLSKNFIPDYLPVDENHPCKPEDIYGLSKFLGEEILKCYSRRNNIITISLRFTGVQDLQMPNSFRLPSKVTLWSTIDVQDVIEAIKSALESGVKGNETFNIASEKVWAKKDSVKLIKKYYSKVRFDKEYFIRNPKASLFKISKAKKYLKFKPSCELNN